MVTAEVSTQGEERSRVDWLQRFLAVAGAIGAVAATLWLIKQHNDYSSNTNQEKDFAFSTHDESVLNLYLLTRE